MSHSRDLKNATRHPHQTPEEKSIDESPLPALPKSHLADTLSASDASTPIYITIPNHAGCWPTSFSVDTIKLTASNKLELTAKLHTAYQEFNASLASWTTYSDYAAKIFVAFAAYLLSIQNEIDKVTNTLLSTANGFNTSMRIIIASMVLLGDLTAAFARYVQHLYVTKLNNIELNLSKLGVTVSSRADKKSSTINDANVIFIPSTSALNSSDQTTLVRHHAAFFSFPGKKVKPSVSSIQSLGNQATLQVTDQDETIQKLNLAANKNSANYNFWRTVSTFTEPGLHAMAVFLEVVRQAINAGTNEPANANNWFNSSINIIQYTLVFAAAVLASLSIHLREKASVNANVANDNITKVEAPSLI